MTKPLAALAQNAGAHDARRDGQRLLMCAPDDFDVRYVINPWMEHQIGKATRSLARAQWEDLRRTLARSAQIELVTPAAGLPDMVFTANAGFVLGDTAVVSRFRAEQRRPEEPLFHAFFAASGLRIASWPQDVAFEGAGDALIDRAQPLVWCGYGMRSDAAAPQTLERLFQRRTIGLRLVDPRFYHLDTCFCPLARGFAMYHPPAFDRDALDAIAREIPPEKRIEIGEDDAMRFSCNAVDLGGEIVMNDASPSLRARLVAVGFTPMLTPLAEFMKAGGAAKCLTLKLVEP